MYCIICINKECETVLGNQAPKLQKVKDYNDLHFFELIGQLLTHLSLIAVIISMLITSPKQKCHCSKNDKRFLHSYICVRRDEGAYNQEQLHRCGELVNNGGDIFFGSDINVLFTW